mgnify:CR=1 FL=1
MQALVTHKKRAGHADRPSRCTYLCALRLFALTEQLDQHHEHVDEVQIEAQRAHDGGLAQPLLVARGGGNVELVNSLQRILDLYEDSLSEMTNSNLL